MARDIVSWEPLRELSEFRRRMDDVFESFVGRERGKKKKKRRQSIPIE